MSFYSLIRQFSIRLSHILIAGMNMTFFQCSQLKCIVKSISCIPHIAVMLHYKPFSSLCTVTVANIYNLIFPPKMLNKAMKNHIRKTEEIVLSTWQCFEYVLEWHQGLQTYHLIHRRNRPLYFLPILPFLHQMNRLYLVTMHTHTHTT